MPLGFIDNVNGSPTADGRGQMDIADSGYAWMFYATSADTLYDSNNSSIFTSGDVGKIIAFSTNDASDGGGGSQGWGWYEILTVVNAYTVTVEFRHGAVQTASIPHVVDDTCSGPRTHLLGILLVTVQSDIIFAHDTGTDYTGSNNQFNLTDTVRTLIGYANDSIYDWSSRPKFDGAGTTGDFASYVHSAGISGSKQQLILSLHNLEVFGYAGHAFRNYRWAVFSSLIGLKVYDCGGGLRPYSTGYGYGAFCQVAGCGENYYGGDWWCCEDYDANTTGGHNMQNCVIANAASYATYGEMSQGNIVYGCGGGTRHDYGLWINGHNLYVDCNYIYNPSNVLNNYGHKWLSFEDYYYNCTAIETGAAVDNLGVRDLTELATRPQFVAAHHWFYKGSWTASTKTLVATSTGTTGAFDGLVAGDKINITAGSGVTPGLFTLASNPTTTTNTDDTCVLVESIASSDATDIEAWPDFSPVEGSSHTGLGLSFGVRGNAKSTQTLGPIQLASSGGGGGPIANITKGSITC